LGDAVIDISDAGVEVKGIIENVLYFGSEYNGLVSAGVDVGHIKTEPLIFFITNMELLMLMMLQAIHW